MEITLRAMKKVYEPYNLPRQKLPIVYYSAGDIEIIRETIISGSVSGKNNSFNFKKTRGC